MHANEIDISVYVLTYFHEDYIKEALDSILSQKTHYSYEIVVSDDGSTDDTMSILEEYKRRYPDTIRVYHNNTNLGIPKNIYKARCLCRGKYIVELAGDDYWINDYKLEEQASFLEEHREYIAVGNRMELRYDFQRTAFDILPQKSECNRAFTLNNYEQGETLYTHGFMMRNFFLADEGRDYFSQAQLISDKVDDAVDNVLVLIKGDVFIMDIITDVYRVPSDTMQSHNYNSIFTSFEKTRNTVELYNQLHLALGDKVNLKAKYANTFAIAFLKGIKERQLRNYIEIYKTIPQKFREPIKSSVAISAFPKMISFIVNRIKKQKR